MEGAAKEEMADKLRQANLRVRDVERSLAAAKKDVSAYQDMLEQSQVSKPNKSWLTLRSFVQGELL